MAEVENLSGVQPEIESVDLRKVVGQQLDSLRQAGLSHLPRGTGTYSIDWEESAPVETSPVVKESSSPLVTTKLAAPSSKAAPPPKAPDSESGMVSQPPVGSAAPSDSPVAPAAQPSSFLSSDPYGPSLQLNDRKTALEVLRTEIAKCTKCEELSSKRTQTVFGVGNPTARLVFVGEGPGYHEDRLGEPFVGDAGEQLNKILKASKLSREDVFILNAVKCRPPGNRNPSQTELSNCWTYAERQLEILQPEFIVCLGSVAARTLLKTTQSLGRLRKQFHAYRSSRVLVTYHPAYLLRTPSAKRHVWDDMKMLMKEMGIDWTK